MLQGGQGCPRLVHLSPVQCWYSMLGGENTNPASPEISCQRGYTAQRVSPRNRHLWHQKTKFFLTLNPHKHQKDWQIIISALTGEQTLQQHHALGIGEKNNSVFLLKKHKKHRFELQNARANLLRMLNVKGKTVALCRSISNFST